MGFAVDHEIVTLGTDEAVYAEMEASQWWKQPRPAVALAELYGRKGATWRYGAMLHAIVRDLLTPLPDGASVLVISHSGVMELTLVSCLPDADHSQWTSDFAPCAGARLTFGGVPQRFREIEFLA